ncbi:MAG: TetR/AcrR family transcriptional regulator, partial [Acidimicrobiales bacterium]
SEVALEEVAREAGVGVGTLYRHFPTRQALLEAIFLDDAKELTVLAEKLSLDGKPYEALVTWLRVQMAFGARGRSLGAAVLNAKHTEGTEIYQSCVRMRAAGEVLLLRAQEAGQVRPDVLMTDLVKMIHGIVVINEQSNDDPGRVDRMFDLVMGGLRAGAGAP